MKIFPGVGWGEVLVIPYYDMPGRICAFYFIGRGGRPEDRRFCVPRIFSQGYLAHGNVEAGLAGLDTIENAYGRYNGCVLALADPFNALQLQMRHLHISLRPLPIVTWYDGKSERTQRTWQLLAGWQPVFFTCEPTAALINQAIHANGKIAWVPLADPSARGIYEYLMRPFPCDTLAKLFEKAKPCARFWANGQGNGPTERSST